MKELQRNQYSKIKFSTEEKRNYCKLWKKSSLNRTDFCKEHGISRSALYQWSKEFIEDRDNLNFAPMAIEKNTTEFNVIQLNITFSNNSMQLNIAIPEHRLISFIQEIGYAATIAR